MAFRLILVAMLSLMAAMAIAQTYPARPVRLVVPFPAGGSADVTARLIGSKTGERIGQPVVIENRVGATGTIGSEFVARAAPDGYTLLMTTPSSHLSSFFLSKNVPYHPVRDFTPITAAAESVTGLVVGPSVSARTLRELLDYARANPGKLTYSSSGIGSGFHLTGELLKQIAGIDIVHVPYKGAGQALNDLMAGTISMTLSTLGSQMPYIRSGKVRLIAVLETSRYAGFPDVPTVAEAVPGFVRPAAWMGFFGPAGLPAPILQRINGELVGAIHTPEVRAKLQADAFSPIANSPEDFAEMVKAGVEVYGRAVKAAGLKPE